MLHIDDYIWLLQYLPLQDNIEHHDPYYSLCGSRAISALPIWGGLRIPTPKRSYTTNEQAIFLRHSMHLRFISKLDKLSSKNPSDPSYYERQKAHAISPVLCRASRLPLAREK